MKIVEDFEFVVRGNQGKYSALYRDFIALPYNTAVKFAPGEDFDVEPQKFAISLRTAMWNKGYKVRVAVREDGVYALIVGRRVNKDEGSE